VVLSGRLPDQRLPSQGNRRESRHALLFLLLSKESRTTYYTCSEAGAAKSFLALLLPREFHLGTSSEDLNQRLRRDPSLADNGDRGISVAKLERHGPLSDLLFPSNSPQVLRLVVLIRAHRPLQFRDCRDDKQPRAHGALRRSNDSPTLTH